MSQQNVVLKIPDALYERVRQVAKESDRPVEDVLLDSLALFFGEIHAGDLSPESLAAFSDEQLWAIVHRPLAWPVDVRLRELTELGKAGQLSDAEYHEMEQLIDAVDHYVLLRTEALVLLKQRGYDVERRLKLGA